MRTSEGIIDAERQLIGERVDGCPPSLRGGRVLIRRLPGLEDSSRRWSVWMTLDHLRICHGIFTEVVPGRVEGRVPEEKADTAAVKPSPEVMAEVEDAYGQSCDRFRDVTGTCSDLRSEARYAHPWFGPLDAAGWHALAAIHLEVHRKQLERIVAGLVSGSEGPGGWKPRQRPAAGCRSHRITPSPALR